MRATGSQSLRTIESVTIGGIIALQTIDPTKDRHRSVTQGFGSYGTSQTITQTTVTFGYAVANGVT